MRKTITCVICPSGCKICVEEIEGRIEAISGNRCRRGEEYAREEIICPKRTVTSTIMVKHGNKTLVPVRTTQPVPKAKIKECMGMIANIQMEAPIEIHQTLVRKIAGTEADLIATAPVERI